MSDVGKALGRVALKAIGRGIGEAVNTLFEDGEELLDAMKDKLAEMRSNVNPEDPHAERDREPLITPAPKRKSQRRR